MRFPFYSFPVSASGFLLAASLAAGCSAPMTKDTQIESGASGGRTSTGGAGSGGGQQDNASGGAPQGTGGSSATGGAGEPDPVCEPGITGDPDLSASAEILGRPVDLVENGGDQFRLEGPVFYDGVLYLSQFRKWGHLPPGHILAFDGSSFSATPFLANAGTNGLALGASGDLLLASHKAQSVLSLDWSQKTETDLAQAGTFASPNDLVARADGNIYFTDPAWQCETDCPAVGVYRIAPDGSISSIPFADPRPNGIALSPQGTTLYVGGSSSGVYSFPVAEDGSVGAGSPFASGTGALDGFTVDCAGNLYLTRVMNNEIVAYRPNGEQVPGAIATTAPPTNLAFGGAERKTLYITLDDGNLAAATLNLPGLPY